MLSLLRANPLVSGLSGLVLLLMLLLAVQSVRLGQRSNQLERAQINLNECRKGRDDDRAAYKEAQRKAAELNQAEVTRIEKEQEAISHEVQSDLSARLERLRSELRNAPAQRDPNRPQAGADGKAPGGVAKEAGLCLAPAELLRAAESEERYDQLITWVEKQLGVAR